jgi:hypothetical protein
MEMQKTCADIKYLRRCGDKGVTKLIKQIFVETEEWGKRRTWEAHKQMERSTRSIKGLIL